MKDNEFGKNLRELRTEKNLSQPDLGNIFSVSRQTISSWESGQREPCIDTLIKIAKYFNVITDFLLGTED